MIDHKSTDEIVCPYCGIKFSDSWEYHDSDGEVISCQVCDKQFNLTIDHSVDYTTSKIACADDKHEWEEAEESYHINTTTYETRNGRLTRFMLPDEKFKYLVIQKCRNCDKYSYKHEITKEEWIAKYPGKYEMYLKWIEQDKKTLPIWEEE